MGGKLSVLMQPFELMIIGVAGVGAYITANTKTVLRGTGRSIRAAMKWPANSKADYIELLSMMYVTFKLAKTKGNLVLEQHIENTYESELSKHFPSSDRKRTRLNSRH